MFLFSHSSWTVGPEPDQPAQPAFAYPAPPAPSALAASDLASADVTPAAGGAPEASDDALPATDTSAGLPRSDRR